jgi:3-methyladenine DNA glycosylase/8-oxoguanine DNA glycosylase
VQLRAPSDAGIDEMRFVLALDDDHTEFLQRFARDPLIGEATQRVRGLRPLRTATVAQALLRAVCGQLIQARRARAIERNVIRALMPQLTGTQLHAPPDCKALGRVSPAELRRLGLGMRRGSSLVRLCRSVELERLRELPGDASAERLLRERGLGPWSVGVVFLEGLGRYDRGLVADLGLVKLCSALRGRWVEGWETAELLEPYGEWAGLASIYLLAAYRLGLVPLPKTAAA